MNHVSRERPEPDVALASPLTNVYTPPTAMEGAAVSLAMFPLLFLIVIFQLLYIRKVETR